LSDLQITISGPGGGRFQKELVARLRGAHRILSPPLQSLSVAIVDDATMSALHAKFLGERGPTDVLTFELEHTSRGGVSEGEVIVCLDEARRRARENGIAVKDELLLYALHGMLHLCGFSDRTKKGHEVMHATEDRILTDLGVGPVFHRGSAAPLSCRRPATRHRILGGR